MKWLIYLLLLVNISLFAWHYRSGFNTASSEASGSEDVQSLVLLREKREKAAGDAEQPWCYSLGPLKKTAQAEALMQHLQQWQLDGWQRKSQEAGRKGYWVLLPPLPSRTEARAAVTELKKKGITDYFLVATGENSNGVSLGVFSSFELAHRRVNQLSKLGFKAVWEEVRLPIDEYWVDWPRQAGGLSGEQLNGLRKDYPDLRQIERHCQLPGKAPSGAS
jgi:hypothetical protein